MQSVIVMTKHTVLFFLHYKMYQELPLQHRQKKLFNFFKNSILTKCNFSTNCRFLNKPVCIDPGELVCVFLLPSNERLGLICFCFSWLGLWPGVDPVVFALIFNNSWFFPGQQTLVPLVASKVSDTSKGVQRSSCPSLHL